MNQETMMSALGALFEVLLGGLVGLGVLYLWFTGLFDRSPESFAREFAGAAAIDCGTVDLRGDPSAVDRCVRAALSGTEPFYAWYYRRGIDSRVARGVARASDGVVYLLEYDGDPSGGAHVGAKFFHRNCLQSADNPELLSCERNDPRGPETVFELIRGGTTKN